MVVYAYCTAPPTKTSWHMAAKDLMMSRCSHRLSPCTHSQYTSGLCLIPCSASLEAEGKDSAGRCVQQLSR